MGPRVREIQFKAVKRTISEKPNVHMAKKIPFSRNVGKPKRQLAKDAAAPLIGKSTQKLR